MTVIFLKLLNMSITAGWLILAIMLLRLMLRKMPRWIVCALWGLVAVRLLCPVSIESGISLIPCTDTVRMEGTSSAVIHSGIPIIDHFVNPYEARIKGAAQAADTDTQAQAKVSAEDEGKNGYTSLLRLVSRVWLAGAVILLGYAFISYFRLRRNMREAVPAEDEIWISDEAGAPFILGLFRPRIYLPSGMETAQREAVLEHERVHLHRRDHLWKPLGYFLLSVYWFHPLCWIAYSLFRRDIELACDERVIRDLSFEEKKGYCQALLDCSLSRRKVYTCPLAFSEIGVKERIKNVLNYKKPGFWLVLAGGIVCIVAALCFLTDPVQNAAEAQNGSVSETVSDTDENIDEDFMNSINENSDSALIQDGNETLSLHEVMERILGEIPLTEAIPVDELEYQRGDALYLLDETEDGSYTLYGFYSEEYSYTGMLINYLNNGEEYWNYLDNQNFYWFGYEFPQLQELNAQELTLQHCWGTGTGVHVDKFYHLQAYEDGTVSCQEFTEDMITTQLAELIELRLDTEQQEVQVILRNNEDHILAVFPYADVLYEEGLTVTDTFVDTAHIEFLSAPSTLLIGIGISVEESVMPIQIGSLAIPFFMEKSDEDTVFRLHDVSSYRNDLQLQ